MTKMVVTKACKWCGSRTKKKKRYYKSTYCSRRCASYERILKNIKDVNDGKDRIDVESKKIRACIERVVAISAYIHKND